MTEWTRSESNTDNQEAASRVRELADNLEQSKYVAFAVIAVDENGDAEGGVMTKPSIVTVDTIDDMLDGLKSMLFESLDEATE